MRYTTVIDISEYPTIYKNFNARMVYFHLALKSGYHNDDRDKIRISIRQLSYAVGISVSATRHALSQLQKAGLLRYDHGTWDVLKWVLTPAITARPRVIAADGAQGAAHGTPSDRARSERATELQYRKKTNEDYDFEDINKYEQLLVMASGPMANDRQRRTLAADKDKYLSLCKKYGRKPKI